MNGQVKDVAKWLNTDLETALKVVDEMAIFFGADFSEDSEDVLKALAMIAYAEIKNLEAFA